MSNEKEGRAPMLDERLWYGMIDAVAEREKLFPSMLSAHDGMEIACDWYEAKITSGELMVVNKATMLRGDCGMECSQCEWEAPDSECIPQPGNFCPGCGAQIVKPTTEEAPDPRV